MKKIFVLTLMILLFLTLVTSHAFPISTGDVLENMVKAQGGKKNLAKIQDSTLSGSMVLVPMNLNGSISIFWKSPNKRRADIELTGIKIIQAYDGKIAWMDNPQDGGLQEMPEKFGKSLKRQALGYDTLFNYKKIGGVSIPHTITVFQEGQEFVKMTFDKVSFNSDVEESLFNMPK
jgi:hypothetical protein